MLLWAEDFFKLIIQSWGPVDAVCKEPRGIQSKIRSTQRNRSTKYPLHRPMFFWLANFSLFNWLVIFFCFYEILLGDQLQNKFAWDFNYFLCCWLETANRLRSGWRLITGIFPYRKLPTFLLVCLPERFYAMFIAFHVAVVLFFIITKEMHHYWPLWSAFDFKSRGWWCNRAYSDLAG